MNLFFSKLDEVLSSVETTQAKRPATARFEKTYCSQCGGEFGPGSEGFSHCSDHRAQEPTEADWSDFADWCIRQSEAFRADIAARDERIEKLTKALERMLDAFYEDPLGADTAGAVEQAYAAIELATGG